MVPILTLETLQHKELVGVNRILIVRLLAITVQTKIILVVAIALVSVVFIIDKTALLGKLGIPTVASEVQFAI